MCITLKFICGSMAIVQSYKATGTTPLVYKYRQIIQYLLLLILGGGYFAAAETAFASVNRIRLQNKAEDGHQKAKTALYITEHFEEALSSILVGNNIMHIGTASLATLLAQRLWVPAPLP